MIKRPLDPSQKTHSCSPESPLHAPLFPLPRYSDAPHQSLPSPTRLFTHEDLQRSHPRMTLPRFHLAQPNGHEKDGSVKDCDLTSESMHLRRDLRQQYVQVQTGPRHRNDIRELVEGMLASRKQCIVWDSGRSPYLSDPAATPVPVARAQTWPEVFADLTIKHDDEKDTSPSAPQEASSSSPDVLEDEGFGEGTDDSVLEEYVLRRSTASTGQRIGKRSTTSRYNLNPGGGLGVVYDRELECEPRVRRLTCMRRRNRKMMERGRKASEP
jgi:hypothetical protein